MAIKLLDGVSVDTDGSAFTADGGPKNVLVWATDFGSGTVAIEISPDNGTTWYYPSDLYIDWGSNSPDYNNEIADSNGYFGVKFDVAPETGTNNVHVVWTPKANKYKVLTTLIQPNDGNDYIELRKNVRLLDHAIELLP